MRSSAPMPGNPWPHDMSITVDDRPHNLMELLWLREAYELQADGDDVPPLLVDTPVAVQDPAVGAGTRDEWEGAWPRIWRAALAHAGLDHDPRLFDELHTTANGSAERAELLHRIAGTSWRDEFGDTAFDHDSYATWSHQRAGAHLATMPTRLEDQPERRDLSALIPAWRAGLTKIVTIPCVSDFTRRVGENALLTTTATRENSDSYRRALSTFV
ncbi:hypothetical protein [Microbacterium sp. NPDC087589]|uniref:hypothetical protein n=1 Tax=Microbacterium sp. NPDC087589 TaxID=3364191 RepID=UPI00382E52C2